MHRSLTGALLCAACVCACRSAENAPTVEPHGTPLSPSTGSEVDSPTARAMRAIQEGELERARDLLDGLLFTDTMARARSALDAGSPADALTLIDRALGLEPANAEVRLLKADASLLLAESKISGGGGSVGLIEGTLSDALEYYQGVIESAHSLFGASRAAWLLNRPEEALALARRGVGLRGANQHSAEGSAMGALELLPERIYAEQVYVAYANARAGSSEEAPALFVEAEDALAMLLGRSRDDPWSWSRLSDLYEWEGRLEDARRTCERALQRIPEDVGLIERLARVSRGEEGAAASVAALEGYVERHPEVAAGRWQLSVARFYLALEGLKAEPRNLDSTPFEAAEADFRGLAERFPEYAQAALGYQVVARLARGWGRFHAGELDAARLEFLSMNELSARGVEWALPGELESGIQGLFFVADSLAAQGDNLAAGTVFETLRGLQADEYLWANNAGFFLRDAAFALELEGKRLCRAARGRTTNAEALAELRAVARAENTTPGSGEEREAFLRAANENFHSAAGIMERSWQSYQPAAGLVRDDVRVVNDAALVLVYYLHHDLEQAEEWLLRCVELGGPQIEAKRAELAAEESPERAEALEAELELLTEAWGDAHQNLGVLEWVHRKNGPAAEAWLVKSLEIWPERVQVRNSLLPQVRGELAPEEDDPFDLLNWAQPCQAR